MKFKPISQYMLVRRDYQPAKVEKVAEFHISETSIILLLKKEVLENDEWYLVWLNNGILYRTAQLGVVYSNISGVLYVFKKGAMNVIIELFYGMCISQYRTSNRLIDWYMNIGDEILPHDMLIAVQIWELKRNNILNDSVDVDFAAGVVFEAEPKYDSFIAPLNPEVPQSFEGDEEITHPLDMNIWNLGFEDEDDEQTDTGTRAGDN